ncbi:MAG: LysR family transcriptional regulator [Pseudomonadota bacterium]
MNLGRIDLNLLVYFDALMHERSVTRAADKLGVSQPAVSNGLRRLRQLFNDPLLVRTREGMAPTQRALEIAPTVRDVLGSIEKAVQPRDDFDPQRIDHVFHIVASDYTESTLLPAVLRRLREQAPAVTLDVMTPSDVSIDDVEQGKVDAVINRFDSIPQNFHQAGIWHDSFACLMSADNPVRDHFTLDTYLKAQHVWVSKTGMGVGVGVNPDDVQRLGWVDEALSRTGRKRNITVFTRHYQAAMLLAEESDLIVTLPSKAARLQIDNPMVVIKDPPFSIPSLELQMIWSPLLQHNSAHQWMRRLIVSVAQEID